MRPELSEAFAERLRNTPDPNAVLAGVRAGVERRRFRSRILRISAAVVAVLAAVATTVTVNRMRTGDVPVAKGEPGIERTTTIALGWVPDDLEPPVIESTRLGDEFHYQSPLRATHRLSVWVDNLGWKPPFDTALGPHESWTEVNGRRARVTLCCGYAEVAFELPSGRWAVVARSDYAPERYAASPEMLRSQALRVAESIREGSGVRVRVTFEPSYLPEGHQIVGVRTVAGAPPGFGTVLTAAGSLKLKHVNEFSPGENPRGPKVIADLALVANITVAPELPNGGKGSLGVDRGRPNASVQGQPAYVSSEGDGIRVPDFHGGLLTVEALASSLPGPGELRPQVLPLEELRKIAEGVRWVG